MLPYINILGRQIPMYGVCGGAGLLLSLIWLYHVSRRDSIPDYDLMLAFIYSVAGGILGGKILWLLMNIRPFIRDLPMLFSHTEAFLSAYIVSGFVFYGGLMGIMAGFALACRVYKLDFWPTMRSILPMLPFIHAFGRVGCFMAGCCYGVETQGPLGIAFTHSQIAPNGVRLVPTQLLEAACLLAIFVILALLSRRASGKTCLGVYLLSYCAVRFTIEFFRGDTYRGFLGPLSTSQVIALVTLPIGLALILPPRRGRTE